MFTYNDWLIQLEHHKDLLREAEKERLVKIALSARKAEKEAAIQKDARAISTKVVCCKTAKV